MKNTILASLVTSLLPSLLAASSFAQAPAPQPPTPPPAPRNLPQACATTGGVLFEVATRNETWADGKSAAMPTWTTALYATGGWSHVERDAAGKTTRSSTGCLDAAKVHLITIDLSLAHWTVKHADAACAAISSTYVQYSSYGKSLWAAHMCSIDYLDPTSQKAIDEGTKILDEATKLVLPPCCKKMTSTPPGPPTRNPDARNPSPTRSSP